MLLAPPIPPLLTPTPLPKVEVTMLPLAGGAAKLALAGEAAKLASAADHLNGGVIC
jgi:hypothetical protein